jgi:hypothetical protein
LKAGSRRTLRHGGQHHGAAVSLGVGKDVGVVAALEAEVLVVVQGLIVTPNGVHPGDVVLDVASTIPIPDLDLVLLGVQVFLRASVQRR